MKQQVMLDLETLGVNSNAVILSIGACVFNSETGEIGDKFYDVMDFEDACNAGAMNSSTIKWWMAQSDGARKAILSGTNTTANVLQDFSNWMTGRNALVWGNGVDFDNVILMNLYKRSGLVHPWGTYNNRCFRTLKNIVGLPVPGRVQETQPVREGTHHNALDDAVYQAKMAMWFANQYGLTLK